MTEYLASIELLLVGVYARVSVAYHQLAIEEVSLHVNYSFRYIAGYYASSVLHDIAESAQRVEVVLLELAE